MALHLFFQETKIYNIIDVHLFFLHWACKRRERERTASSPNIKSLQAQKKDGIIWADLGTCCRSLIAHLLFQKIPLMCCQTSENNTHRRKKRPAKEKKWIKSSSFHSSTEMRDCNFYEMCKHYQSTNWCYKSEGKQRMEQRNEKEENTRDCRRHAGMLHECTDADETRSI